MPAATAAVAPVRPAPLSKRKRSESGSDMLPPSPTTELDPHADQPAHNLPVKRVKTDSDVVSWPQAAYASRPDATHPKTPVSPPLSSVSLSIPDGDAVDLEPVKDVVQFEFSHEILIKHGELRVIDQELAKCQIALEQLRRCHLIPYPTDCPTPQQMLDIASGRGIAVRPKPGAAVPKWAAPFGVVDGPYARHYAKWLIPDPVFDGPLPNWPGLAPAARAPKSYATAEARATRNSAADATKARTTRGVSGQKLHALSNGYPQPKDRVGPCVLKRIADGKVVKLVCTDCHRDNFSSTQGFINHCRIAHKRDYKSHEEAAIHCGHPIEVDTAASLPLPPSKKTDVAAKAQSKAPVASSTAGSAAISVSVAAVAVPNVALAPPVTAGTTPVSAVPGRVHPLARPETEAANVVLDRIHTSYKQSSTALASESKAKSGAGPRDTPKGKNAPGAFVGSDKTPFLSSFLEKKQFGGDLEASVEDAKEVTDINSVAWYADGCYDFEFDIPQSGTPAPTAAKRGPSRSAQTLASTFDGADASNEASRPSSNKSTSTPSHLPFGRAIVDYAIDDAMDVDLSPIPSASNNAPSLVSDDGEFDDSDDGSSSEASDAEMNTVSDIAEINTDEDEDQTHDTPRPLRRHSGSVKLKKDESKHVAFVSPVKGNTARRG